MQKEIQKFVFMVENQFEVKVQQIRSDNGPEFSMPQFYGSKGSILHQTNCCVATPQQNARVERKHQHILNVARGLLFQANLPKKYWNYAIVHVVFLINRVPSKVLCHKTAYEKLFKSAPDLFGLKVFGSLCFMSTHATCKTKFDSRSSKCVFLGYKEGTKGYIMLDLNTLTIHTSQDVLFQETVFPYVTASATSPWQYLTTD